MRTDLFMLLVVCASAGCGSSVVDGDGGGGSGAGSTNSSSETVSSSSGPVGCECDGFLAACGVDGVTYNAACPNDFACVGADLACRGACPCPTCDELIAQYATALAEAKQCNPLVAAEECTLEVPDALSCYCSTFINAGNGEARTKLAEIEAQFEALDCAPVACPPVQCEAPSGASCAGDGASGSCVDQFGN